MNDFTDHLQVSSSTMKRIERVQKIYNEQNRELEFRDKVALAIYNAILEIKTKNREEEVIQKEYMEILNKFLYNYDKLKPIIEDALKNKNENEGTTLNKED